MYTDPKYLHLERVEYFIEKINNFCSKESFKIGLVLGSLAVIFALISFFIEWVFILLILLIIYCFIYNNDIDILRVNYIHQMQKIYREYELKFDDMVADLESRGLLNSGQTIKKLGFHPRDKVEFKGELQIEYGDLLNNIFDNYIHDLRLASYLCIKNIFLKK